MKPEDVKVPVYREMAEFCEEHNVVSFAALCEHAAKENPRWLKALCSTGGTRFMSTYIRRRYIDLERKKGD